MKVATLVFCIFGLSTNVFACSLNMAPGVYTEIAVPCQGSHPDASQPVAVNQATQNGGECRVSLPAGDAVYVDGSSLLYASRSGEVHQIGALQGKPSCYQTDSDGEFYSLWVPVRLATFAN